MLSPLHQRQTDDEATAVIWCGFQIDTSAMSCDDALRNGQAEAGAAGFLRDERLEDVPAFFQGDARSRIRNGNQHLAVASTDIQAEVTLALHGLQAIAGDIPKHLGQLVGIEGKARDRWFDA
jgi:hypothetical protein